MATDFPTPPWSLPTDTHWVPSRYSAEAPPIGRCAARGALQGLANEAASLYEFLAAGPPARWEPTELPRLATFLEWLRAELELLRVAAGHIPTQPLAPLEKQHRPRRPWLTDSTAAGGSPALGTLVAISDIAVTIMQMIDARPLGQWSAADLAMMANRAQWLRAVTGQLHSSVANRDLGVPAARS